MLHNHANTNSYNEYNTSEIVEVITKKKQEVGG